MSSGEEYLGQERGKGLEWFQVASSEGMYWPEWHFLWANYEMRQLAALK